MKRLGTLLTSRWCISFVGTALLAGLAWVFGPLLPRLEDWPIRLALVLVMLLAWAVANLLVELRRRERDSALAAGVTADAAAEAAALGEKLAAALRSLKRARRTRGYLYEQPWYAIIGPPGAGKTTALLNAGLRFPLGDEIGRGALAGVGGTRLCEWWFAEDAVLIDTAGRYTTQDSAAAVDRAGWEAFLGLLKRTRPRQPLNGVIVAIAVGDVAQVPAAERLAHARAIRARLDELRTRLGVRLPVYHLFTKADLIAGFTEFFDDLDEAGRAQVWGATFALGPDPGGPVAAFGAAFRGLIERLNQRLVMRLEAEPNPARRALIAMFPRQVASLEQPLGEFLQAAYAGARDAPAPLLRGAYLSSGTQEGTPIDRLLGALSRSFGLDQRRLPALQSGQGRSYFLARLLRDVIFGEAMLVARDPAAARRRAVLRGAGFAIAALAVLAAGAVAWRVQTTGQRRIDAVAAALGRYEQVAGTLPLDPVADADLASLLPLLDEARALPHGVDSAPAAPPPWWELGLSQDAKLAAAARAVYRHALEHALLPRLLWRLEAQLRGSMGRPDFLYEATRIYLMLGNAGPLNRELVQEWMKLDWQMAYPGEPAAPLRARLLRHLDALLADPLPSVALDGELVAQVRGTFASVSLAQRAYSRVRPSAAAQRLPPWRPSDALGAAGVGLFERASGKPLSEGVPGFLTVEGFHKVLLPALGTAANGVLEESWVLGKRVELDPNGPQTQALQHAMIALYEADYAQAWDAVLADLNIAPMRSLPRAAQNLYILASPESPMRALLVAIARQLRLSRPPGGTAPAQVGTTLPATDTAAERLQAALGAAEPGEPAPAAPGEEIDARYKPLLALVGDGPGAPIDLVLKSLIDLQQQMAKLAAAPVGSLPPVPQGGSDPAAALRAEAIRQPQPLARWLATIAESGVALRGGNPRDQVTAVFNAPDGPAARCPALLNGSYPFARGAASDLPIDAFARVFAPGGELDGFLNTLLRPYVDMSGHVWRPQAFEGSPAPVSAADLAQFQRAAAIRDLFFAAGGTTPSLRLDIAPISLDRRSQQATLEIGGVAIAATHEAPRSAQITWPGLGEAQSARLVFDPPPAGQPAALQEAGPWSLFRLFSRGKLQATGAADRYTLTFRAGDREAAFEIRMPGNPFAPGLLQDFRCPQLNRT
jgi:type VI secretion system protein ImpL